MNCWIQIIHKNFLDIEKTVNFYWSKMFLFFAYCRIINIFTGPTHFFDQSRPKVWCLLDRLQMYIKDKHENPKCETACNFPEMIRDMSDQTSISIVCE